MLCDKYADAYNENLDLKQLQGQLAGQLSYIQHQAAQQQMELNTLRWEVQQGRAQGWTPEVQVRLVFSTSQLQQELDIAANDAVTLMTQQLTQAQMSGACRHLKAQWSPGLPSFSALVSCFGGSSPSSAAACAMHP